MLRDQGTLHAAGVIGRMGQAMETSDEPTRVKLVTVLAGREYLDDIKQVLLDNGANGYTIADVDGRGVHGTRKRSWCEPGNVRVETILAPTQAKALLVRLAHEYRGRGLVAFAQDAEAIPSEHFA
jgi:hypothetical protein